MTEWIGVDLDGTLAHYNGFKGITEIGEPIPNMLVRVRQWIKDGHVVKIFTARATDPDGIKAVKNWLSQHGLGELEITNIKDHGMIELWDDQAVQVELNTGMPVGKSRRGLG